MFSLQKKMKHFILFTLVVYFVNTANVPAVITTWRFSNATRKAWDILRVGGISLDAIEQGLTVCEVEQCDGTVGYGGSPDEKGETTLDALIIDGKTLNVGAVAALRRIKHAISVARHVLDNTKHSFLVGELATQFAIQMGFKEESLSTLTSKKLWNKWHNEDKCQPNFWMNVQPNPNKFCGPYKPMKSDGSFYTKSPMEVNENNHDTIGMIAIDTDGNIAAGTSTNGAKFKIPGRVGDSPIPGSGAYADNEVGGAAATGDGDVMLRFLPSFLAVEEMRRGALPQEAARIAVKRILAHYPTFMGAVIAMNKKGHYGAACNGLPVFPYVVQNDVKKEDVNIVFVHCL